jgi:hypothetical protein
MKERHFEQHPGEYSCEDVKIDCIEKVLGNEKILVVRLGTQRMEKR